jgi:hypothetical protein
VVATEFGLQHSVEIGLVMNHMAPPQDRAEQPQEILGAGAAPVAEARLVPQRQQEENHQWNQGQGQGCRRQGPEVGLELQRQRHGAGPVDGRRLRDLIGRNLLGQA